MAQILLPQRFLAQPQYPARLNESHWAYRDLVFAYSAGRGVDDAKHGAGSITGSVPHVVGPKGRGVLPANDSSYLGFSHDDYNVLGDITVLAVIRTGGLSVQQGIVTKCETGGGGNTPFALLTESGGAVSFNRSNASGGTPFRVWASAATLSSSANYVIAASQVADISVAPKFYINGVFDTGAANSLYSGAGTGAATGNATSLKIGNRTDLATRCYHDIYDVLIYRRVLTDREIVLLSSNVYSVWKAPDRRIFIVSGGSEASGAGSSTGVATVSGVGASIAGTSGSSASSSTVSGVGASVADSVGSASGSSTVSGVGDAVLPGSSVGSASGTSSASGVGASTAASSGSGNGVASVSGVGASTASTQGSASGSATVSGVGDSTVPTTVSAVGTASGSATVRGVADTGDSLGGDDAILIYEEPKKKKRKPKKRLEDIINDAIGAIAKEAESIPAASTRAKESPKKEVVPAPVVKADPVEQFRAAEEEAQKVSALLAQYQEEVKRREFEEDEELLMLIAMEML